MNTVMLIGLHYKYEQKWPITSKIPQDTGSRTHLCCHTIHMTLQNSFFRFCFVQTWKIAQTKRQNEIPSLESHMSVSLPKFKGVGGLWKWERGKGVESWISKVDTLYKLPWQKNKKINQCVCGGVRDTEGWRDRASEGWLEGFTEINRQTSNRKGSREKYKHLKKSCSFWWLSRWGCTSVCVNPKVLQGTLVEAVNPQCPQPDRVEWPY